MKEYVTIEELWLKIRGLENAFRYYADVVAAMAKDPAYKDMLRERIEIHSQVAQQAMAETFPHEDEPIRKPPPPCPPWCSLTRKEFLDGLQRVAAISSAVTGVLSNIALERGGKDVPIDIYVSELPGTHWHKEEDDGHR